MKNPNGPTSDFLSMLGNDATLYNAGVVPGLDNDYTATSKVVRHRRKQGLFMDPRIVIFLVVWGTGFIVTGLLAMLANGLGSEGHHEFWFLALPFLGFIGLSALAMVRRMLK